MSPYAAFIKYETIKRRILMRTRFFTILAAGAVVVLAGSAAAQYMSSTSYEGGDKDIVETAISAGSFETLVAAVKAAGLVETLQGEGPFTVFAPTDDAFAKLPEGTVESLLLPENREKLIAVLTYHVVPGKLMAKDVVGQSYLKTVQGEKIKIQVKDGEAWADKARIVKTDIDTSNGVIHVIDSVILPKM
jgi:uncharacterized surface protein with fasciclin (FAS1) repeats